MNKNQILKLVCQNHGIAPEDLKSENRNRQLVNARHQYCFLAKSYTFDSLKDIGESIGGRDHSTVINSIQKHSDYYETEKNYKQMTDHIEAQIKSKLDTSTDAALQQIERRINQIKDILYSPDVINSNSFRVYKDKLNTLLEIQECHNRKRLIREVENTLQNSKLV